MPKITLILCVVCLFFTPLKSESPYKLSTVSDIIILGGGSITGFSSYLVLDRNYLTEGAVNKLSTYDINSFDRRATDNWSPLAADFSEAAMVLSASALLPLLANSDARNDFLTIGVMSAEMLIWSVSLPQLFKVTATRNRPYVYNESVSIEHKLESRATESFFSRTTTLAFASAVFSSTLFDAYYPDSPYSNAVWISSLACASAAGYLKYYSGQHFTTDVLTGALVGSFIGWFIPYIHRRDRQDKNNLSFVILPAGNSIKGSVIMKL